MRVAIEEDSEDEEEPTIEDVTAGQTDSIVSKFPLTKQKDIDAHNREALLKMKQGAADFMKKFERMKAEAQKQSKITVVNNPITSPDVTAAKTDEEQEREAELKQKLAEVEKQAAEAKRRQEELKEKQRLAQ